MTDSRNRFSDRVDDYLRYRPDYPDMLLPELMRVTGITSAARVADIGAGTGIFSRDLLAQGFEVFAVEPNQPMRQAAEADLGANPRFHSIDGSAEESGLAASSCDLITAAQSFHWFNNAAAGKEFIRILKPDAPVALIWNRRDTSQPLQKDYEGILREFAPEYGQVNHMNLGRDDIAAFLRTQDLQLLQFSNHQRLDFNGLLGRLKSSSYCPPQQSPAYIPLVTAILALFDHYAVEGQVDFGYQTEVYVGRFDR